MKHIAQLLAQRYLWGTAYEKNISIMVRICFVSILIGSFALALVSAIMNGFELSAYEKMQGIHAQVIIRAYGNPLNEKALNKILHNFNDIKAFSPITMQHALIDNNEDTSVVLFKGIDPIQEACVTNFEKKLEPINGVQPKLSDLLYKNHVIIGKKLAQDLNIHPGDTINLLHAEDSQTRRNKITMAEHKAIIGGIFNTGIDEFDSSMIVGTLNFVKKLYPDSGVTQINIKLKPNVDEKKIIKQLQNKLNLEVYSWKDLYPALVAALKLEKYAMFFILALITLVASMNIISLLFMQITQKRSDIAILHAIGAYPALIERIFLYMGMGIAATASIIGIVLAWIVSLILEYYPFITLPDIYYTTHLPAKMEWSLVITVFIVVMGLSFFATWLTARRTRTIKIANVLRFEG